MSKEESLILIRLEKITAEDDNASESMKNMLNVVEKNIEEDRITYADFKNLIAKFLEEATANSTEETTKEDRSKIVEGICNKVIEYYGAGKEE
ncbi:hypothetical protein [uncultured phage cr114_1]|uniref:Uncharacterized protein n=1 Tax=uncultured phage cr114_1 TaxID=2772088 RepID=A0A7M1S164_9CAUD|nr:hypothetical protein KNV55_gp063 [uncultured phage cr114_1]QOR59962.1 hypothetical protein [uncultured phage cr114_1]DAH92076.1 MAG TPA: hypothetical protein [Caudoviricetes sp.]